MNSQTTIHLLIGIAVLALLIVRNLRARPVRGVRQRLFLVLGVLGVVETYQYLSQNHAGASAIAALIGSLVLATVFGVLRARTVRVWIKDGQPWSRGSILTATLWVAAVAVHLGYDALLNSHKDLNGLGEATIVLYLVVSMLVQRVIVTARASRLSPATAGGSPWTM